MKRGFEPFQWKEGAQGRVVVDALVGRSKVGGIKTMDASHIDTNIPYRQTAGTRTPTPSREPSGTSKQQHG